MQDSDPIWKPADPQSAVFLKLKLQNYGFLIQKHVFYYSGPYSGNELSRLFRMCTLTGTPDAIVAARAQINAVIANEGQRMGGGGGQRNGMGGGMGGGGMGGGNFEMMIEGPLVARVIGKGGENIKRLQEETGAKIVIIQVLETRRTVTKVGLS